MCPCFCAAAQAHPLPPSQDLGPEGPADHSLSSNSCGQNCPSRLYPLSSTLLSSCPVILLYVAHYFDNSFPPVYLLLKSGPRTVFFCNIAACNFYLFWFFWHTWATFRYSRQGFASGDEPLFATHGKVLHLVGRRFHSLLGALLLQKL